MREADIERRLRQRLAKTCPGVLCLKFESPGYTGVPDRILLAPGGLVAFVELKAPGKKERPRQVFVQEQLRNRGFTVFSSVDSYEKVEEICSFIHTLINNIA